MPEPIGPIHLLHGQQRRRSKEAKSDRDLVAQEGCSHTPRRTEHSAKHTCRVSGRARRRAEALQDGDEHQVRHGRDTDGPPATRRGGMSSSLTQPSPRRLRMLTCRLLPGRRASKLRDDTFRPHRGWAGLGARAWHLEVPAPAVKQRVGASGMTQPSRRRLLR